MHTSVALGDIARFIRGITFKPEDVVPVETPGAVACMRTKNVQAELDLVDVWGVPEGFVKRADQFLRFGDTLVSSANSWNLVGKCCWVPDLPWKSTFGGFVSVLRAHSDAVEAEYLFRWFASPRTQQLVRSFGRQTTNISNLDVRRCLEMRLSLPSRDEQRAFLERLHVVARVRRAHEASISTLDELASVLQDRVLFCDT